MKKHFIIGVLCGAFLMATTSVFASSMIETTSFPSKVTFFLANGFSKEVQLQEGEEVLNYKNKAEKALSEQTSNAAGNKPLEDSRELQLQDMLVISLLPHIQEKLAEEYADVITVPPVIHPDYVNVKSLERVAAFRGFDFLITIDAQPIVGPHIPVGEDELTYRISPAGVELKNFEHLRGPVKDDFLPNYQNLLK
ncbi:hypothetical protein BC351_26580 [Paenibacillus ferrarius]|uniref:DUF302 domain-containing protein n=1 Tax=Paenibacillus ferrarius TaxID=1469647 RepID=A0A1V4HJJ6_9BACL|nr:DUF3888 domain-containing protein [Paenibacillus ferrarius]OPH56978.1 hypothetical protein BC351_26580 [Paenibacillus ferrarius]